MAPPRLWLSFMVVALVVSGCPRRFDPRAAEIHSNNPEAEADYRAAQRKWQEGDLHAATDSLKTFFDKHSHDPAEPLLPLARLLEARVARGLSELDRARELLLPLAQPTPATSGGSGEVPTAVSELARFELGLTEYRRGEFATAQKLLIPFSNQIVEGEEATELHAILADLYRRTDQPAESLREYERYYKSPQVRPLEQVYVRTQVSSLLPQLTLSGDELRAVRSRFALETTDFGKVGGSEEHQLVVGLCLPLSGKERALGERVLRGALFSAGILGAKRNPTTPGVAVDVRVRDSGGPGGVAAAVAELQREGAQVIIGSPTRSEAATINAESEKRGLVAISLAPSGAAGASAPTAGHAFHIMRTNEARAEALAQNLLSSGLRTVAVLAPATPYGQNMTRAFTTALAGSAVQVVAQLSYPGTATTFTAQARQILDLQPQALFIPAAATQLELIAGQLAAVGALATYRVEKRENEPPVKLLLASAEGMGERLLKTAGRYLQGAVLAPISPGGVALASGNGAFSGYAGEGGEPGALDALGFDAVKVVQAACGEKSSHFGTAGTAGTPGSGLTGTAEPPCSAEQLAQGMRTLTVQGATGPLAFDAAGMRRGAAWLLRVEGTLLRAIN